MSQTPDLISIAAIITAVTGAVGGLTAALSSRKTRKQVQPTTEDGRSIVVMVQNIESLLIDHITDKSVHPRYEVVLPATTPVSIAELPATPSSRRRKAAIANG